MKTRSLEPSDETPAAQVPPGAEARDERLRCIMMRIFAVVVFVSGLAFVYKLYEFFLDLTNEDGLRFAGAHLLTYVLVAGGFMLLLLYIFLKGHFADIEAPKFDMLRKEIENDREEFLAASERG